MARQKAGRWSAAAVISAAVVIGVPVVRAADSQALKGIKRVTSIEGITEYALDNGLKVLLFPDLSKPTVTVNMTVFVGSRQEGYGESGMAHLLEHMLFKGTPEHPNIPAVLKERGARFNGTTWVDRTNYYETLPASDANLEFAIRLEADRLVNSYVRGADLKFEMTVVRNEFEMGENSPEQILEQRMIAVAYEWHNYGKSTIGNRADIERVPIKNLQEFYARHYQPDNAMLVVAGKFDPAKALDLIVKTFGRIPRPERELNNTYTEEPAQDGQREVRLRRVGTVAIVGVVYHVSSGGAEDFPAIEVLEGILSDDPSGRLYKSLVQTKKAAEVSGTAFSWHDPGVIIEMASVPEGKNPETALKAMLSSIDDVARRGVTKEETERIKQQILKQREMAAADSGRIAVQLSDWAAKGDWRLYFLHRDRIEKVTPADVSKAAARYLKPDNSTIGLFVPTKTPDRTTIPMMADLSKTIGNYKGRQAIALGEAFEVSPASIDARTKTQVLHSGLKAALLEKKTRGREVHLQLRLKYGDVGSLHGMNTAAQLLPHLMLRGTKHLSHQQIQDALDKERATLRVEGSPGEATFSIQTRRESLPAVLKLLGEILREPSLPESELELIRQSILAELEKGLAEPDTLAFTAVRRHVAPYQKGDPRYIATIPESIDALKRLTVADLKKLYSEYLSGSHGELAVVGDFDSAIVVGMSEAFLGDWKASMPYTRISRELQTSVPGGSQTIATPDKTNATYASALVFPMRDDDPEYPALTLGNFILGGGTLSSRLGDRVRQKDGLSYGVHSTLNASSLDRRAAFLVYAICNPVNIEKVRRAIAEEIDRLLKKGIPQEELAKAKQGYLQQEQVSRTRDASLAAVLGANLAASRTMKYYADLEKRIAGLTADEVLAALRSRIDPKRLYIVTAGDFSKTEASAAQ